MQDLDFLSLELQQDFITPTREEDRQNTSDDLENEVGKAQGSPIRTAPTQLPRSHGGGLPSSSRNLVLLYLDDWLVHQPVQFLLLHHQSVLLQMLKLVGFKLNLEKV